MGGRATQKSVKFVEIPHPRADAAATPDRRDPAFELCLP
jgi:hypothetical protein